LPNTPDTRQSQKNTRHRADGYYLLGKDVSAECFSSGTRQTFAECLDGPRQKKKCDERITVMGTLPSVVVTAKHSANFNFWAAWIQVPRNSILSSVLFRALGKLAHCQVSVFMRSVFFLHPAYSRFPVVHSPIDNKTAASSMHESFESLILRKSSKVLFIYL